MMDQGGTAFRSPGARKRRSRATARGRQTDPQAAAEVAALLGDASPRRELLIEYLHLVQDRYRHISHRHLKALADALNIPMAEAFEVATFYHHFDVVREGEPPPPPITVRVCESLSCAMAGADDLCHALSDTLGSDVRVVRAALHGTVRRRSRGQGGSERHRSC